MIEAYLMPVVLLAISPFVGKYALSYVYPDVKTLAPRKKWVAYFIFGLGAYIPVSVIMLLELLTPLYSPLGTTSIIFNYEGNALYSLFLFLGVIAVNASVVDFVIVRRKKRIVIGIPKKVIRYEIKKQIKKSKADKRQKEIVDLTTDLKGMMPDKKEVTNLLDELKNSVGTQKQALQSASVTKIIMPAADLEPKALLKAETEEKLSEPVKDKEITIKEKAPSKIAKEQEKGLKSILKSEDHLKELVKAPEEQKIPKGESIKETPQDEEGLKSKLQQMLSGKGGLDAITKPKEKEITVSDKKEDLEAEKIRRRTEILDKIEEIKRADATRGINERKGEIIRQLEEKVKKEIKASEQKDKTQELLNRLKEKVKEDMEEPGDELYADESVNEIARGLRELHSSEKKEDGSEDEEIRRRGGHHAKERLPKETTDIEDSLLSYEKAYPKRKREDILKEVVGDVRNQLMNEGDKAETESDAKGEKTWYETSPSTPIESAQEFPMGAGVDESNVELFEDDIGFGDDTGGLGEDFGEAIEGDFDDLAGLERMDDDLETGNYDDVFVDMEKPAGGCPNCGKTGTAIVYCPNCGKAFCSNCALSVEGSDEFIKYKCPHCQEEFAVKRRAPA